MKQENVFKIGIIVVAVLATSGVVGFLLTQRAQEAVVEKTAPVEKPIVQSPVSTEKQFTAEKRVAKAGYKIVEVKNPDVPFSFEIPEKWSVETRNSGEKKLSIEEMRDFLGTRYTYTESDSGNVSSGDAYYRGGGGVDNDDVKKQTQKEVQQAFKFGDYPNASISAVDYIWYGEFNGFQIDFHVENLSADEIISKTKKEIETICKKEGDNFFGCGDQFPKWEKALVDGKNASIQIQPAIEGEIVGGKPNPAGKTYYIEILNSNKTLVVNKQAKGDAQFEKDFDNLIQTLKIK
jgi:hypothetical protein